MHRSREFRSRQSRVTAVFEDRALSFILAKGATLGDLSDRISDLGQPQPVAVTVKFGISLPKADSRRIIRRPVGVSGLVDGLRQRMDAENSEQASVEHCTR
jgi:hypothetical protein